MNSPKSASAPPSSSLFFFFLLSLLVKCFSLKLELLPRFLLLPLPGLGGSGSRHLLALAWRNERPNAASWEEGGGEFHENVDSWYYVLLLPDQYR